MRMIRSLIRRLALLLRRRQADRELADELHDHLARALEHNIAGGMTPEMARRAATLQLGGVEAVKDETRDADRVQWLHSMSQDVRFALRTLARRPVFTVGVLAILGVGLGATTAIFSVVNGVLLTPLPYRAPDRLVRVFGTWEHGSREGVSPPDFTDVRRSNTSFESVGGIANSTPLVSLQGAGGPEQIATRAVTAGFFATLGITPIIGREFRIDEEAFTGPRVAMLSHSMWKDQLHGADVVDHAVSINGLPYTVVGILPPFFNFVGAGDVFTPVRSTPVPLARGVRNLIVVGRLKPGIDIRQAQSEMDVLATRLERDNGEIDKGWAVRLAPLTDDVLRDVRSALLMLLAVVGLVVLLMSANIASLVLSQASSRGNEMAVRMSLGASTARVMQQLITESLLLALAGGAVGCALAAGGIQLIKRFGPSTIPRLPAIGVDGQVLAFVFIAATTMGLLFGLEPAWRASRHDLADLVHGTRSATRRTRIRDVLVLVEVAVSVILLVGSGLLIRSILNLERVDPGFESHGVLTARLAVPGGKFADPTGDKLSAFWRDFVGRLATLPSVTGAAITSELPLGGLNNPSPRTATTGEGKPYLTFLRSVSPSYAGVMRIPIRSGRFLSANDLRTTQRVVVINDQFEKEVFGGRNPIGQTLTFNFRERRDTVDYQAVVVGVIGSVRHVNLATPPFREAFLSFEQSPLNAYSIVLRSSADPAALAAPLRSLVSSVDAEQSIGQIKTLPALVDLGLAQPKFRGYVLISFACFALILAAVGLYGLLSLMVAQRTREIGIRSALGASSSEIAGLVFSTGMRPTVVGVVVGTVASAALARLFTTLVFGVSVWDVVTFTTAPFVLIVVAVLASCMPAHRATRIDPAIALRAD